MMIRFGIFELDDQSGKLRRHGLKVRLPEQSFQILRLLLDRPDEVVTREELRQLLWASDTSVDFDAGLNSAIRKLRDALDDSADNPRFVETLPRRGYRFIGSAKRMTVDEVPKPVAGDPAHPGGRIRREWIAGGVLVAMALAAMVVYRTGSREPISGRTAAGHIRSLAVLRPQTIHYCGEGEFMIIRRGDQPPAEVQTGEPVTGRGWPCPLNTDVN